MFTPPDLSLDESRDRIDRLSGGDDPRPLVADLLPTPPPVVPGPGWLVVTLYEASGEFAISTLAAGPTLDRLRPDLELLNGRVFFDAADLRRDQAAAAARVEASLAVEPVDALCERYRGAAVRAELASLHGTARLQAGVPELCLGVSAWTKCAG
jgi:hypothetical protein